LISGQPVQVGAPIFGYPRANAKDCGSNLPFNASKTFLTTTVIR